MKLLSLYDSLSRARKVTVWSVLWLGPLFLSWSGLILLSHQTTEWAIMWTQRLFVWMILMTYVFLWSWAIGISRQPRLTLFRGIAWTITPAIILLCLELVAVLKLVHWNLLFEQLTGDVQNLTWAYQRDSELGFRRRPYDRWVGRPTSDIEYQWMMPPSSRQSLSFTYDRWGYRNQGDMEQADIALIGDSYVEGWYVSDEETTAIRLQARLGLPVINLGISGYGTAQEFRALKLDAHRFNPQVIIFFFFEGNDLYDDHSFENYLLAPFSPEQTTVTPERWAQDQGWTQRSFTFLVLRWLRRLSNPVLPNNSPYFGQLATPGQGKQTVYFARYASIPWSGFEADRWKKTRDTLAQVAKFSEAEGIHVLFTFVPIKFRVYQPFVTFPPDSPCTTWSVWPIAELFLEFCQSTGVPCLDLTELFQEAVRDGGMPYSAVDSHWSPEGHDLVAQKLATTLRHRDWLSSMPTSH